MSQPPTTAETLVVFRPRDLPAVLTTGLPPDAALRDCLCYLARSGTRATAGLYEALPEPPIAHAALGQPFVRGILRIAARSRRLAELLYPERTREGPAYLDACTTGIHAGNADEVEAWLSARGHRLVPVGEVLDALLLLLPTTADGFPPGRIAVLREVDGLLVDEVLRESAQGVFALEREGETPGPVTICSNADRARLASLPATGLFALKLGPRDPKAPRPVPRAFQPAPDGPIDLASIARAEVAALLDPRGVAHDPRTSWPIWFLLPAALGRGAWDAARGGRALYEQADRPAIVGAVVARWTEHVLEGAAFEIDDLPFYREAMAAGEAAVGVDAMRAAGRVAVASIRERAPRCEKLTAPRPPRRATVGPGVSRCVECLCPVRGRHYVLRCDRGHEGQAHPACARRHVARLLGERAHGALACSLATGCHLVACARGGMADDPYGARALQAMVNSEARQGAVRRIFGALVSGGLVEARVGWKTQRRYHVALDEAGTRSEVERLVDAIDAPERFREAVRAAVLGELLLR